jgi:wobble nucleotide-excising tRNase
MGGTEERIFIIDDPFTSFDSGRKQRTIDILARLSGKVKQMIVFTHDLDFGERISSKIFPKSDLLTLQMFSQNGSSNIRKINFSRELLTGLMKNITLLHDFLNNGVENEIEINNVHGAIRKSLEGIFRIKFFEFNKGNAWLGTYLECIEKSETEEEYKKFKRLLPYLQDLRDIASYSNQSHHDESIYGDRNIINSSELKSYVGETLEMIDKI